MSSIIVIFIACYTLHIFLFHYHSDALVLFMFDCRLLHFVAGLSITVVAKTWHGTVHKHLYCMSIGKKGMILTLITSHTHICITHTHTHFGVGHSTTVLAQTQCGTIYTHLFSTYTHTLWVWDTAPLY